MEALLPLAIAVLVFWAGRRHQAYIQARVDVKDVRSKLRDVRAARRIRRASMIVAWAVMAAMVIMVAGWYAIRVR
jgi:hypothetical protein